MFHRVYRLEIRSSHVCIFDPALWTIAPLTFSRAYFPRTLYTDSVWLGGGGGVLGCVGDSAKFNTLYLTRFKTYKIALDHPKQKPRRGGGPPTEHTCRNFFFNNDIWHCFLTVWSFYGLTHGARYDFHRKLVSADHSVEDFWYLNFPVINLVYL